MCQLKTAHVDAGQDDGWGKHGPVNVAVRFQISVRPCVRLFTHLEHERASLLLSVAEACYLGTELFRSFTACVLISAQHARGCVRLAICPRRNEVASGEAGSPLKTS